MTFRSISKVAVAIAAFLIFLSSVYSQESRFVRRAPQIVLVRGFMDVFSTGLDQLAASLQNRGHGNVLVISLTSAEAVANQLASSNAPIVLIGHSLGANAVIEVSRRLNETNIPVRLLVLFDATESLSIPANVARVVNFYQHNGGRAPMLSREFRGTIESLDLSTDSQITHTNIDKNARLHAIVTREIEAISK